MRGGTNLNIAGEFAQIVATMEAHPLASLAAGFFIILLFCVRKDGLFSRYLTYLGEKARLEAAQGTRRLELIKMAEERAQPNLPGAVKEEAE